MTIHFTSSKITKIEKSNKSIQKLMFIQLFMLNNSKYKNMQIYRKFTSKTISNYEG